MSEENLKSLPLDDLIDLMVISVNELITLHKNHDYVNTGTKTLEIQIIQKIIADKKVPIFN